MDLEEARIKLILEEHVNAWVDYVLCDFRIKVNVIEFNITIRNGRCIVYC